MSRIRVDDLHKKWMKDSKYRREYDALEEEFSLVAALIEARTRAGLTQEQVAQRMKTTQAVIARLEGGGSKPSTRTLERCFSDTGRALRWFAGMSNSNRDVTCIVVSRRVFTSAIG